MPRELRAALFEAATGKIQLQRTYLSHSACRLRPRDRSVNKLCEPSELGPWMTFFLDDRYIPRGRAKTRGSCKVSCF